MSRKLTEKEVELAHKLLEGAIPVGMLLHIQESASRLEYGSIEVVLNGHGAPLDVITRERVRFSKS